MYIFAYQVHVCDKHSENVYNAKLQANVSTLSLPNRTWLHMGVTEEKNKYNKVMTYICMVLMKYKMIKVALNHVHTPNVLNYRLRTRTAYEDEIFRAVAAIWRQ